MGELYEALVDYEAALGRLPEDGRKLSLAAARRAEVLALTVLAAPATSSGPVEDGRAAYERGEYAAAQRIWLPLADAGSLAAAIALGNLYWTGKSALPDAQGQGAGDGYGEAAKWYRKAADKRIARAHMKLGEMYSHGLGVPKDLGEAVRQFGRAADLGDKAADLRLEALNRDALALAAADDHAGAIVIWLPLAERGDADAEFNLARSLLLAGGIRKDPGETMEWLRKSADRGNPRAQFLLASFYRQASHLARNDDEAAAWLRGVSTQLKDGITACNRGDYPTALKLLTPLARFGEVSAQSRLGEIYERGKGVAPDLAEALKWYRLAADQGDFVARLKVQLGTRLSAGIARYNDQDYAGAIADFDAVLDLDADFVDAWDLRGWAYSAEARRDMAVVSFARARDLRLAQGWVENAGLPDGDMRVVIVRGDVGCEPDCPAWISAEGRIVGATVSQFKRVFKEMGDKRLPVIIQSPGGDVQAALAIGRLICSKKLDVAVGRTAFLRCLPGQKNCQAPKGGYRGMAYSTYAVCASACPLVLAAGGERLVGTLAAAAVHQVKTVYARTVVTYEVKYQIVNGRKVILSKTPVARKTSSSETVKLPKQQELALSRYLREMGIDQSLIAIMTTTPYRTVHRLSSAELDGLHMVTKPAEGETLIDPRLCTAVRAQGNCENVAGAGG